MKDSVPLHDARATWLVVATMFVLEAGLRGEEVGPDGLRSWLPGKSVVWTDVKGRMRLDFHGDGVLSSTRPDFREDDGRRRGVQHYEVLRGGTVKVVFWDEEHLQKLVRFRPDGRRAVILDDCSLSQGDVIREADKWPGHGSDVPPPVGESWQRELSGTTWRYEDTWVSFLPGGQAVLTFPDGNRDFGQVRRDEEGRFAFARLVRPEDPDWAIHLRTEGRDDGKARRALPVPTDLAEMDKAGFESWLEGTLWMDVDQGGRPMRRATTRFHSDRRFRRGEEGRVSEGTYQVPHPGFIVFEEKGMTLYLSVSSDLTSGKVVYPGWERRAHRLTANGELAKLGSQEEFHRWLVGTSWRFEDGVSAHIVTVNDGKRLTLHKPGHFENDLDYEVLAQGLIEFNREGDDAYPAVQMRIHDDLHSASVHGWAYQAFAFARGDYPHDRTREPMFEVPITGRRGLFDWSEDGSGSPPPVEISRRLSQINALLVAPLPGGRFAGASSTLTLAAIPQSGGKVAPIGFNQEVGKDMATALAEVVKFHQLRHGGWPRDHRIEFSFADKYSGKDGGSAAMASALLIESLLTGVEFDMGFAVTGDMNIDGSVQPVGGVAAKLRGAAGGGATVVAIPDTNKMRLIDLCLSEGSSVLLQVQVFAISSFDDALALARQDRPGELGEAIGLFGEVRARLKDAPNAELALKRPDIQALFARVLDLAPHHLSAHVLLLSGQGRLPDTLTLTGSLEAIHHLTQDVLRAVETDATAVSELDSGRVAQTVNALRRLRPMVDPRTRPLTDSVVELGNLILSYLAHPPSSQTAAKEMESRFRSAGRRIDALSEELSNDRDVMEELLR